MREKKKERERKRMKERERDVGWGVTDFFYAFQFSHVYERLCPSVCLSIYHIRVRLLRARTAEIQKMRLPRCTMGQNVKNPGVSTGLLACPFACTAYSFVCSALLCATITHSLAHFAHSQARGKLGILMSQNHTVLNHSAVRKEGVMGNRPSSPLFVCARRRKNLEE